jgi:predicted restriction endonuclease
MSRAEADIIARIGSLTLWKRHGERAPHKPLLIPSGGALHRLHVE